MKKLIAISVLMLTVSIFSGCVTNPKGTYSEALSDQYTMATQYSVIQGRLQQYRIGVDYRVYIIREDLVQIYTAPVVPNPIEEFYKNATIDENGVIDTGWKESSESLHAYFGPTIPPTAEIWYFYYSGSSAIPISRGYNVICYTKEFNAKYAEVKGLGIYASGKVILYNFEK